MKTIPVETGSALDLLARHKDSAQALLETAQRLYGAAGIAVSDRLSKLWLARTSNPYRGDIDAIAAEIGAPGAHMLNLSYEWGCTAAAIAAPEGGNRLLRTLDWPLEGLGRHAAVLRARGPAGEYYSLTWPGFAGVLTAMAPGRFSAAINQAKRHHGAVSRLAEWPVARARLMRSNALPPAHLLRRACEEARGYDEAVAMLSSAPVCAAAFFTVSGIRPDQGCVVERLPNRAYVHRGPVAQANHFRHPGVLGEKPDLICRLDEATAYIKGSRRRQDGMAARMADCADDLSWVAPPVLVPDTRLAALANAARGRLLVRGYEAAGPATEILLVQADIPVAAPLE